MKNINRILVSIAAVVVVIGGIFLLSTSTNKNTTATQTQPTTTTTPIVEDVTATQAAITVGQNGFSPKTITVKVGTNVVWANQSGRTANVSSDDHPTHTKYSSLNLGNFDDGQSVSLIFDKVGTYTYHNHLNATQTGTIVVE